MCQNVRIAMSGKHPSFEAASFVQVKTTLLSNLDNMEFSFRMAFSEWKKKKKIVVKMSSFSVIGGIRI